MRIGIDLDGVVFDSEREFRVFSEIYDVCTLKRNSVIDSRELLFQNRYNWTKEETDKFLQTYHKTVVLKSNFMPGVKEILEMLKKDGDELIVVTARGLIHKDEILLTQEILKKNNMDIFNEYNFEVSNKAKMCKEKNIDIMIDDSLKHCLDIASYEINSVYFRDVPSFDVKESKYIKILYNWGEIYRYITDLKGVKNSK